MGKVIRGCRKGKGTIFTAHTRLRKGPVKLRKADYAEKTGYVKGVVKAIVHESGRGAPIAKVQFQNSYRFQRDNELFVAAEGLYEGAFIYCGAKAQLAVGNVLPISAIPEGTVICNAEARPGDRGARWPGRRSTRSCACRRTRTDGTGRRRCTTLSRQTLPRRS